MKVSSGVPPPPPPLPLISTTESSDFLVYNLPETELTAISPTAKSLATGAVSLFAEFVFNLIYVKL